MKQTLRFLLLIFGVAMWVSSCTKDDERPNFPLSAEVFHSIKGKQVAFQGLTHGATGWSWDFGDGQTSTEQNPVHVYDEGGYYLVSLTATDGKGGSITKEIKLPPFDLTPYAYLVGDHTVEGYAGKKWKLSSAHSANGDFYADADADLSLIDPVPTGFFNQLSMGDVYLDEFTFFEDGHYVHDVKADGGSFGGIVYQLASNGGKDILNANGKDYGLCIAKYTPEANATFTFVENENFQVSSVYGPDGKITFNGVMTLDFSGTEFIGFRDFQRKVIVRSVSGTRMQLIIFMAAGQDPPIIGINTHALVLSFEVVQ